MQDLINSILQDKAAADQAAKDEREREKNKAIADLLESMKSYLGDFYTFLEERYQRTGEKYSFSHSSDHNGKITGIFYQVPVMPEAELAPMVIKWTERSTWSNSYDRNEIFHIGNKSCGDLASALAEARRQYPEYLETQKIEALKGLDKAIPSFRNMETIDIDSMVDNLLAAFIRKWPGLEGRALEMVEGWKKARADFLRMKEEERIEKETREKAREETRLALAAHVLKWVTWSKSYTSIDEANRKIAEEIQERADSACYFVYKLDWGVVARESFEEEFEGEESRFLDVRSAWTLYPAPDKLGFWDLGGEKKKVFFPVSLTRHEVTASSGILAKRYEKSNNEIFFAPDDPIEFIDIELERISPLPDEPEIPEELSEYAVGKFRRAANIFIRWEAEKGPEEALRVAVKDIWSGDYF